MTYIDGFVAAVPTANKQKFIDHAKMADSAFVELGANRVLEVRPGAKSDVVPVERGACHRSTRCLEHGCS